ncbi:TIGR03087 family PEP-CTERM/XrtA system glycosyltransferase [Pseudoduganella plicata]|uniref:Glycosyl transferase n=1 Tax=Pseudoduganella plicata TaxID=321984 RepID=A0A4V1ATZ0_9BURK|nr:TIGR03087 family PEP-CTERM/XrtA system glycosyltransferase [Pseudoduganella plicata]QBQ37338.1 TIGR03087 family PEP-CTERM/XrtA system glycosyltransferase [Pseudoduganella plicata]GGZ09080.1 glycosyl transferase [Pseudoduganella plicata]
MDDLLLLVHRMPYPPNKGDKIRSWHLLRHLAARYRVHLATFVDDPDDWRHVDQVRTLCASSHFAPLRPRAARVRSLLALPAGRPMSLDYYNDQGMHHWVRATMAAWRIERIVVFSSPMAQYVQQYDGARRIVDLCDVDSEKWRQYARQRAWPASTVFGLEARRLLAYERKVAAASDAALFVSSPEAQLFATLAPESAGRIGWYSNGVDTAYFSPDDVHADPYASGERAIVFCGAMDYWPNMDAVQWFARDVLPAVLARAPHARFVIVGARPSPEVQALAALPGVTVTGTVPDVRPYVAHAALSVAPLRVARGIQNKVLEAMSMAKTVVLTPQALEGIDAVPGRDVVVAHDAPSLASAVSTELAAPGTVGAAARRLVQCAYGWDARLAALDSLLEAPAVRPAVADTALPMAQRKQA